MELRDMRKQRDALGRALVMAQQEEKKAKDVTDDKKLSGTTS